MSFNIIEVYEVACNHDDCPEVHDASENHYEPEHAVIKAATDGWQKPGDLHFCPNHRTDQLPTRPRPHSPERAA